MFYYPEPTETEISEAREIDKIVRKNGNENSFVTFSWNSYGLSIESAKFHFDFNNDYLTQMNLLDLTPYVNDINNMGYSVMDGEFEYPEIQKILSKNYFLYKLVGNTSVYLPN